MNKLFLALSLLLPSLGFAYGLGYAPYPLEEKKLLISPELLGIFSEGSGASVQGRATYKANQPFLVEGGFGIGSGERSARLFAGADYEIFPDYQKQPRISAKAYYEYAREFEKSFSIIGLAPTFSKGFIVEGHKLYPYAALPFALGLNSAKKTYHSRMNLSAGVAGNIPLSGYENVIGNVEATVNLKDSYTGLLLSVAYPLN